MSEFWNENLDIGYYDKILTTGLKNNRGIQANWHNLTFLKVKKYLNSNIKHLDYACGSGTLIGVYSEADSIGYDISSRQVVYANTNYKQKANFYMTDELDYLKNENKYDVITVLGLLEFLSTEDNIDIINNLHGLLKPNGKLILTTPNFTSTMFLLEKIVNLIGGISYENQHISKLNKAKLEKLLNKTKFKIINVDKFINFPVFLSFISIKFATPLNNLIEKVTFNKCGYLLMAELKKD
jgi:2-polyprenyl-3-methyl-5-hydroxy-6-metoxy-1,4-benzoquinol methylase